ncbi:MAG: PD-(D/E)XK nuclease family protein, partial [Bacillota bacterium]|nr:PD-(D/E)XK nuclease family protein [Bacillota bacterium]
FPAKWAVSSLNRQAHSPESRAELALSPAAQADSQKEAGEKPKQPASLAAERGIAYHRVLELLDLQQVELPQLKAQVEELCEKALLSREEKALVELRQLERFLHSPVGQRLCASKRVQRETAFTMLMEEQGVEVLVQGMLDAAFEEEDGWVLLDYKTGGRSRSDAELQQLYGQQLRCYRQAIERLWRVPVKEAYLCMLDSGRVVAV